MDSIPISLIAVSPHRIFAGGWQFLSLLSSGDLANDMRVGNYTPVSALTITEGRLYARFAEGIAGNIFVANADGSGQQSVAFVPFDGKLLASDHGHVYVSLYPNGVYALASLATPGKTLTLPEPARYLAAGGGSVFASANLPGKLTFGLWGGTTSEEELTLRVTSDNEIAWVLADETHVYWAEQYSPQNPSSATVIKRASFDGSEIEPLVTLATGRLAHSLAVDGQALYYSDGARVFQLPFGSTESVLLADGQDAATSLTVQGDNIYWVDHPGMSGEIGLTSSIRTACIGAPIPRASGQGLDAESGCELSLRPSYPVEKQCRIATDDECDGEAPMWQAPGDDIGGPGNGFDDDCDGLVDEGCTCTALTDTKLCWKEPSSLTSGAPLYTPTDFCDGHSRGVEACVYVPGNHSYQWQGTCVLQ